MTTLIKDRLTLFQMLPPHMVGVEVGVYQGDFAAQILSTQINRLDLVDCWKHIPGDYASCPCNPDDGGHECNYRRVMERFAAEIVSGRVVVHRLRSMDAILICRTGILDFVYLDADHRYVEVLEDLYAWSKKLKPGGFLMGHDYTESPAALAMGFGVKQAVDDFCINEGWQMLYLTDEEWPSYCLVKS